LIERALRERWCISKGVRKTLIGRLAGLVDDPESGLRELITAEQAILSARQISLANVSTSMKALVHIGLEVRMRRSRRSSRAGRRLGPGRWCRV
jgi:hypothetical protein